LAFVAVFELPMLMLLFALPADLAPPAPIAASNDCGGRGVATADGPAAR
jgi:hypothetical protein